jgi:hypothetical protein
MGKAILSKKSNAGSVTVPNFKQGSRAITLKTTCYWHKNRYSDKWNRRPKYESIQLHPSDFWYRYQKHAMEKWLPLQQIYWENWISACRKLKLDPCLSPCKSINSKWIKDLNKTWNFEASAGKSREYTGINRHRLWLPK